MSPDSIPHKRCPRCKQFKPFTKDFFRVCRREKDGLTHACRECLKKQDAEYLATHREENKASSKARYYAKPEERKLYNETHKEQIAATKRRIRKENPEQTKKHKRDSQKRHRDSHNRRIKRYNEKHPELRRMRGRISAEKRRIKEGKHTRSELMDLFYEQNERCAYCGIRIFWDIPNDMHIDHILPVTRGGTNDIANIALACADCNLSKHNTLLHIWRATRGW